MIIPMLKEAWISLSSHKLRSFLTILGIIIGVCAVVIMVAAGQTVQNEIDKELGDLGGNMMIVTPGSSNKSGVRLPRGRPTLTEGDAEAIKLLKNVVLVAPAVSSAQQVVRGSKNWNTGILGSNLDYIPLGSWEIEEGMNFTERDMETGARYVLIGKTIKEKLFEEGEYVIGEDIRIKNIPFKVIGVLEERGSSIGGSDQDDIIIAPLKTVRTRLIGNRIPDMVRVILLTVDEAKHMSLVERRIETLLRDRHRIRNGQENDFSITNITEMVNKITKIGLILSILLAT
ncbi:ABC transporter permease, partial [Pseudomonadota bacterium]